MKITLACSGAWIELPQLGDAGDTVDVDVELGARLIREGYARSADVAHMKGDEVEQVAAAEGIDLSDAKTVAEKKAAVKAAHKEG
jgi:hypothetical protein